MKKTIAVAAVFFVLGFVSGYIYDAQQNWRAQQRAAARAGMSGSGPANLAGGAMPLQLPEGHPPVDATGVIKTLEEQAAKHPQDPEPRLKLANYYYDEHQFQLAAEWYQKALALDPKNINARADLGTSYFYLGRPQDAVREYREALRIDPKHEPTMFNLIVVNLEGTRDFAAAQQAWDRLHKQNPNYPGLHQLKQSLDAARASAKP